MSCDHIYAKPFPAVNSLVANSQTNSFSDAILNVTNARRAQHDVGPLTWDTSLAASALNDVGKTCNFTHSRGSYGQNLAAGYLDPDVAQLADEWYAWEACAYNYEPNALNDFHKTGHFTQVIWKGATKMGCALVSTADVCKGRGIKNAGSRTESMLICNYDRGNSANGYALNVVKPIVPLSCKSTTAVLPAIGKESPKVQVAQAQESPKVQVATLQESILKATNDRRAQHGVAPLTWNMTLANDARAWANNCFFEHKKPSAYGQNIALGGPDPDAGHLADKWYKNEACAYNYDKPVVSKDTGHFTQTVWADTKQIGCALVTTADACKKNGIALGNGGNESMLFCNYYPPGNKEGGFSANVKRPIKPLTFC